MQTLVPISHAEAARFYREHEAQKAKKRWPIQEDLQRDLQPGWLVPYLLEIDGALWGRWDYWCQIQLEGALPVAPIPRIAFSNGDSTKAIGAGPGRKMLERCLDAIGGTWRGWGSWQQIDFFLDWLLYGFGARDVKLPEEPGGAQGASMRLYQLFDLWPLLIWPYDHWAEILSETQHGRKNGFYPTPHTICEMMCAMSMEGQDCRLQTLNEPACGTGRMLLHASNHVLRLFGQDIDGTLCKVARVNGYLYAPWLAKAIEFDEAGQVMQSETARMWSRVLKLERALCFAMTDEPIIEKPRAQTELFNGDFSLEEPEKRPRVPRSKTERSAAVQMVLEI